MESNEMLLQTNMLNKLHESKCPVNVDIDLWHPNREWIDYFFSLNNFKVDPNLPNICRFISERKTYGFPTFKVTVFCKLEDADYLKNKINQWKEVNK